MIIKLNDFFDLLIVELEFTIAIRYKLILMKNVLKFFFCVTSLWLYCCVKAIFLSHVCMYKYYELTKNTYENSKKCSCLVRFFGEQILSINVPKHTRSGWLELNDWVDFIFCKKNFDVNGCLELKRRLIITKYCIQSQKNRENKMSSYTLQPLGWLKLTWKFRFTFKTFFKFN